MKFSLLGNNSNGIGGKIDSLKHALNSFSPSCIAIQESKLQGKSLTIPGYKSFFKNRIDNSGGGLITAVDQNLSSVQVSSCEEDILVVEIDLANRRIRVINIYGPQEPQTASERQKVLEFWQEVEKQVIKSKDDNCLTILQGDANAKLGHLIFPKDPYNQRVSEFRVF